MRRFWLAIVTEPVPIVAVVTFSLLFVIPLFSVTIALFANDVEIGRFGDEIPAVAVLMSPLRDSTVVHLCALLEVACMLVAAGRFFILVGKTQMSKIVRILRYCSIAGGGMAAFGFLGTFSPGARNSDESLEMGLAFAVFHGAILFQLSVDVALRLLQIKIPISIWIYDVVCVFFVITYASVRVLAMIVTIEEAFSLSSLLEYACYIVVFLKFPMMGLECFWFETGLQKRD
jgi:hypothetical protein